MIDPADVLRFRRVVDNITFPLLAFEVSQEGHHAFLRVTTKEPVTDNRTGLPVTWKGRHWRLSKWMTHGEIVQTAFKAVLTALEHEARETFLYRGVSVLDPHYDVDTLVELRRDVEALVRERS